MRPLRTIGVAVFATTLLLIGAVAAQAGSGVPYTFHDVDQQTFTEEGFCSDSAEITISGAYWLHVNATEAGLSEEEIEEALESEDPEGIIRSLTFTETGTFTSIESNGEVISGRFTQWFGGNINHDGQTIVFTGTFSATGVDQDGNHVQARDVSHVTLVDGEPVIEFERGSVQGCP